MVFSGQGIKSKTLKPQSHLRLRRKPLTSKAKAKLIIEYPEILCCAFIVQTVISTCPKTHGACSHFVKYKVHNPNRCGLQKIFNYLIAAKSRLNIPQFRRIAKKFWIAK